MSSMYTRFSSVYLWEFRGSIQQECSYGGCLPQLTAGTHVTRGGSGPLGDQNQVVVHSIRSFNCNGLLLNEKRITAR